MDHSVYALRKSSNGSLFLPVLHYDSHQKEIRYWGWGWGGGEGGVSVSLEHVAGRNLGGEGGLGTLLEDQFGIQFLESTAHCLVRFEFIRIDFGS